jgi:anti-anti-sigma regulatory factor
MPFSMTNAEGKQLLTFEGDVTVRQARDLVAVVAASLDGNMPIEIDTSQLTDIDTCICQFLFSLKKSVPKTRFVNPSESFIRALERSQLRRTLLSEQETA